MIALHQALQEYPVSKWNLLYILSLLNIIQNLETFT